MRIELCALAWIAFTSCASAQGGSAWLLPNFSDRLEFVATNPGDEPLHGLAVLQVSDVRKTAPDFPGTFALCMSTDGFGGFLPMQVDRLDEGTPAEVAVELSLAPHASRTLQVYYSNTLHDQIPWKQQVSADHAYGYNRATAALESELIGYRTYGGFLFDVQAHGAGKQGLFNSLLGYSRTSAPPEEGRDIVHYGQTLGLGGIFLQSGQDIFRPTFNTPDYVHKKPQENEPVYRVLASGPLRAVVEAVAPRWHIGQDEVAIRALYEMRAGEECVRAHVWLSPTRLTKTYTVGTGVIELSAGSHIVSDNMLAVTGTQDLKIGALALGVAFAATVAAPAGVFTTADGKNRVAHFSHKLQAGVPVELRYNLAASWSGSGYNDPLQHVSAVLKTSMKSITVSHIVHQSTPTPGALEGEPH